MGFPRGRRPDTRQRKTKSPHEDIFGVPAPKKTIHQLSFKDRTAFRRKYTALMKQPGNIDREYAALFREYGLTPP